MNILVTGSSGKLGSATVKHLRKNGYNVIGIDLLAAETTDQIVDIQDSLSLQSLLTGIDAIIHTAALHGKHYDLNYSRADFVDVNIKGTLNLLNACTQFNIHKFLYTSTTSIYGTAMTDPYAAVWVDELLPEQPRDIYDITKQTCEQLCKDFFYKEGIETSVYRVARFLPETDNLKANHRLYRGLDERDGAEALKLGLEHNFKEFEVFNISSGSPFNKQELKDLKNRPIEVIKKYYPDIELLYKEKGWFFPESIDRVYCTDKAKNILGYAPRFTFESLIYSV